MPLFINCQVLVAFTQNTTGFTSIAKDGIVLTYSVGELASIAHFTANNNLTLSTGFIQAYNPLVTSINDINFISNTTISLMPNPTTQFVQISTQFNQVGQLNFQIFDAVSKLKYTSPGIKIFGVYKTKIDMAAYPAGSYYLKFYFQPNNGKSQIGVYKIIKL
jgi:hypothetical protein